MSGLQTAFKITAAIIMVIGNIHTAAWLWVPDNLGFNPHPWYLASPQWLRETVISLSFPRSNIEVVISYFMLLPLYIGILLLILIAYWLQKLKK